MSIVYRCTFDAPSLVQTDINSIRSLSNTPFFSFPFFSSSFSLLRLLILHFSRFFFLLLTSTHGLSWCFCSLLFRSSCLLQLFGIHRSYFVFEEEKLRRRRLIHFHSSIMSIGERIDRTSSSNRHFLLVPSFNPERRHSWGNTLVNLSSSRSLHSHADDTIRWETLNVDEDNFMMWKRNSLTFSSNLSISFFISNQTIDWQWRRNVSLRNLFCKLYDISPHPELRKYCFFFCLLFCVFVSQSLFQSVRNDWFGIFVRKTISDWWDQVNERSVIVAYVEWQEIHFLRLSLSLSWRSISLFLRCRMCVCDPVNERLAVADKCLLFTCRKEKPRALDKTVEEFFLLSVWRAIRLLFMTLFR